MTHQLNMAHPLTHPYKIGGRVFIRTVTMYYVGILIAIYDQELVLTKASWVSDTGKFTDAIIKGTSFQKVEFFIQDDEVIIGRGSIIDCSIYRHKLPYYRHKLLITTRTSKSKSQNVSK